MATQIQTTVKDVLDAASRTIDETQYKSGEYSQLRLTRARAIWSALCNASGSRVVLLDIEDAELINYADGD